MAWINSVCLVAMTCLTWHGSSHVGIYALIHLYSEYGNAYLSDDVLLYCISLFVGRFSTDCSLFPTHTWQSISTITLFYLHTLGGSLLHIIFIIPMTVNDVNLSVVLREVNGLSSWRKNGEELFMREEVEFSFGKIPLKRKFVGCSIGRVRECLILAGCTIAGLREVRRLLYRQGARMPTRGKNKRFSNLLEGEASMVRWHPNGLDLTLFHDLVGSS